MLELLQVTLISGAWNFILKVQGPYWWVVMAGAFCQLKLWSDNRGEGSASLSWVRVSEKSLVRTSVGRKLWLTCQSAYCFLSVSAKPRARISLSWNQVNALSEDKSPLHVYFFNVFFLDIFLSAFACWLYHVLSLHISPLNFVMSWGNKRVICKLCLLKY